MTYIFSFVTEKHNASISISHADEDINAFIVVFRWLRIFAHEVDVEQQKMSFHSLWQKTEDLVEKIKQFAKVHGKQVLDIWKIYNLVRDLNEGEFFYFLPNQINENEYKMLQNDLIKRNHSDYDTFVTFKEKYLDKISKVYRITTYVNNKNQSSIGERERKRRVCRYCGLKMPEVAFQDKAHTISEAFGNKHIITNDECDDCNHKFGTTIETDLINYLDFFRGFVPIQAKGHKAKFHTNNCQITNTIVDGKKTVNVDIYGCDKDQSPTNIDDLKIAIKSRECVLANVYRAIVKYAIGVVDVNDLRHYRQTIDWVNGNIKNVNLPMIWLFYDNGSNGEVSITLYQRKNEDYSLPYSFVDLRITGLIIVAIIPLSDLDKIDFTEGDALKPLSDILTLYQMYPLIKRVILNSEEKRQITFNLNFVQDASMQKNIGKRQSNIN